MNKTIRIKKHKSHLSLFQENYQIDSLPYPDKICEQKMLGSQWDFLQIQQTPQYISSYRAVRTLYVNRTGSTQPLRLGILNLLIFFLKTN